jgi:hypothetical protein
MRRLIKRSAQVCSSLILIAGGSAWAFTWGQPASITFYFVYASGDAFVVTSNNQNPDSCAHSDYLELDSSQPNFARVYATLIAAYAGGQTISINYNGCSSSGYPLVNGIAVPHS